MSVAAVRRPALRPLAALLAHQTEEWVWPGGFQAWINREVIGSDADDAPLDDRVGFVVNVVVGWTTSLLAPHAAGAAGLLSVSHLGNVVLHVGWAARHRRYDPGLVTAVVTLLPVAVADLDRLRRAPTRSAIVGGVAGAVFSAALPAVMKARVGASAAV